MLELIPKDISEFKTIVLDLTNRCNLKCPLCFRTNTEIDSLYDQDFKHVKQLLKKQISNKTNTILLANIYAEPLLYKYINETLDYIKMLSKLFNKKVNTILETNASYQNKEYWLKQAELSKTHNIKYVFSLCGSTQELHSKYRVNANLEKTINNIKTFINHSDSYEIILIEFKYNQKDIKKLIKPIKTISSALSKRVGNKTLTIEELKEKAKESGHDATILAKLAKSLAEAKTDDIIEKNQLFMNLAEEIRGN